jgi:hypothetical protein
VFYLPYIPARPMNGDTAAASAIFEKYLGEEPPEEISLSPLPHAGEPEPKSRRRDVAAGDLAFGYPAKDQHELAAKCRRLKSMHAANKRRIRQAVPAPVMVHVPIRRAGPIPLWRNAATSVGLFKVKRWWH